MDRDEEFITNQLRVLLETYSLNEVLETYSDYEEWELLYALIQSGYVKIDFKSTQMELDFQ